MSLVYIADNGATIGVEGNKIKIKYKDGMLRTLPIETVDGITLLGKAQLTTQSMEAFLNKGIPVSFFSKGGKYFGRLLSTGHIKAALQRKQAALYETDFALELSKKLISAKVNNQLVVLRRYARSKGVDISSQEFYMKNSKKKIASISAVNELMGYEGNAAKAYFDGLSQCIDEDFAFKGRSKRPPRDEFNSMISLGYSILMNELYSEIENKGLNPYFGFMHKDAEKHPTLASDMIEEWRAVLIDSLAMSMINGHEVTKEDFVLDTDELGCFLTKQCLAKYLKKLEDKLETRTKYLSYVEYIVNFRTAISMQIDMLSKAIEYENPNLYTPIEIR